MEFFKPGKHLRLHARAEVLDRASASSSSLASIVLVFYPGPNYGTDFKGGTEVEVAFTKPVDGGEVRTAVDEGGLLRRPTSSRSPTRRTRTASSSASRRSRIVDERRRKRSRKALCLGDRRRAPTRRRCPPNARATEVKFSPGGDKLAVRYDTDPDLAKIKTQLAQRPGREAPRRAPTNPQVVNPRDHRVEIQLQSKGDQLLDVAPQRARRRRASRSTALRVEWVGPKAGKQLRDSARNAVAIAIVFIMLYLAFRFDLRFAPGVIVACVHDAMVVLGVFVILRKEITLSTIAAVLTIVGYSMNDTVVVYDRIRENLGKHRGKSFARDHQPERLRDARRARSSPRGATMLCVLAFFIWGTGVIKDFAFAMVVGIVAGTYSSIYVAAPLTEWIDHQIAKRGGAKRIAHHDPVKT